MRTIHKYTVTATDNPQPLELPVGSKIIHVADQRPEPEIVTVWADCDDEAPLELREFQIFGTGHLIPEGAHHVGSVFKLGGSLVWHLYEILPAKTPAVV